MNNNESGWDTSDTPTEIAGMRLAFPLAVRVSTLLDVDADLRPQWQEMFDNLAPPANAGRGRRPADRPADRPAGGNAPQRAGGAGGNRGSRPFGSFVYGGPGAIPANEPEAQLKSRFLGFNGLGSFIDPQGSGGAQIFRNRMRLREGPGAIDCEHIAGLTSGIHSTLLNSTTDDAGNEVIEVFTSDWPRSWDCDFQLLAHGGFIVSSSVKDHEIEFVEVHSPLGGPCRLKNPWPQSQVALYLTDAKMESLAGDVLNFATVKGQRMVLIHSGSGRNVGTRSIPE